MRHSSAAVAAALICCAFLTCLPQTINAAEKAALDKGGALEEKNELRKWVGMTLPGEAAAVGPFSLTYDGNPSAKLLSQWERIARNLSAVSGKERRVTTWTDKRTGLEITCEMTLFTDFPAVEWLLRLKNTGTQPTPILENIRPLDMTLPLDDRGPIVFHHAKGSNSAADDYMTIDTPLAAGQGIAIPAAGQRRRRICRISISRRNAADWSGPSAGRASGHSASNGKASARPSSRQVKRRHI